MACFAGATIIWPAPAFPRRLVTNTDAEARW